MFNRFGSAVGYGGALRIFTVQYAKRIFIQPFAAGLTQCVPSGPKIILQRAVIERAAFLAAYGIDMQTDAANP